MGWGDLIGITLPLLVGTTFYANQRVKSMCGDHFVGGNHQETVSDTLVLTTAKHPKQQLK